MIGGSWGGGGVLRGGGLFVWSGAPMNRPTCINILYPFENVDLHEIKSLLKH